MGPIPMSQSRPPLPDTNPNIRKDNTAEKRKRAAPKRFRLQLPSLPPHDHLYQRPHLNPKLICQIANPYLQFQFTRAPHDLVQAKCQVTYLRTGTGCSYQTIWTMVIKISLKMNIRLQLVSQTLSPQLKKKRNHEQSQRNVVGDQIVPSVSPRRRKKNKNKVQPQKISPKPKL